MKGEKAVKAIRKPREKTWEKVKDKKVREARGKGLVILLILLMCSTAASSNWWTTKNLRSAKSHTSAEFAAI